jgi:hypothetical protein
MYVATRCRGEVEMQVALFGSCRAGVVTARRSWRSIMWAAACTDGCGPVFSSILHCKVDQRKTRDPARGPGRVISHEVVSFRPCMYLMPPQLWRPLRKQVVLSWMCRTHQEPHPSRLSWTGFLATHSIQNLTLLLPRESGKPVLNCPPWLTRHRIFTKHRRQYWQRNQQCEKRTKGE